MQKPFLSILIGGCGAMPKWLQWQACIYICQHPTTFASVLEALKALHESVITFLPGKYNHHVGYCSSCPKGDKVSKVQWNWDMIVRPLQDNGMKNLIRSDHA